MHSIAEFLLQNPEFEFNLREHIYDSRFICAARTRHSEFLSQLWTPVAPEDLWASHCHKLTAVLPSVPAWRDWTMLDNKTYLTKTDLRRNPRIYLREGTSDGCYYYRETSGTTGPPTRIWYSPEFAVEGHYFRIDKFLALAGVDLSDTLQVPYVFAMVVGDQHYIPNVVSVSPDQHSALLLRVIYDSRDNASFVRATRLIDKLKPQVLIFKPNVIERLVNAEIKLPSETHAIFVSGANLRGELRRNAKDLWQKTVYEAYGLSEAGLLASECSQQNGLHIFEQSAIVEVLQSDGSLSFEGEGELVVTSVRNPMMPMVRYRTGDNAIVTRIPCECGIPSRRILSLQGRVFEDFHLPSGRRFSPTLVNRLFEKFELSEFRLTQRELADFLLEVQPTSQEEMDILPIALKQHLERLISEQVDIEVRIVNSFGDVSKFERFRSTISFS